MKRLVILTFLVSLILQYSCKEAAASEVKLVTAEEVKTLSQMDDVQLIDVRTSEEYSEGYIEGFENIDFLSDSFDENIKKLDMNKPVIVYCRGGGRSARCAKKMLEAGFTKIYDLNGGITQWVFDGNEIIGKVN